MKTFLKYICCVLEIMCCLTHYGIITHIEVILTGNYCNLANLSYNLNEKFDLGCWTKPREQIIWYENYPYGED